MSSRVFAPKASIQRIRRPGERAIFGSSASPPRIIRTPSPAQARPSQSGKQGSTPCKSCGGTETEEADGNLVCKTCGLVLSNVPNYTSDIAFEEGSNGRIQQLGQRVAEGQTHQKAFAPRGLGGGPGHEATPASDKAKTEATGVIRRYAMLLRIDEREINVSRRIFDMAYNRGFVRGRTIENVAIVSLYIATRRAKDRKPLYDTMLIDFAEQANINVFDLGRMMQDLIKKLYINMDGAMNKDDHFCLQPHGAEVLIDKFVNHLDFGPDSEKIRTDAARILQRMKRDWLHHGRRPSGVCGAAVILAARMNNFRRTLREVVLVAKVTEFTVSKRLDEFKETESSNLSVDDFRKDDILDSIPENNPPAFSRGLLPPKAKGKRGRKKRALETAAEIEGSETESQISMDDGDDDDDDDADTSGGEQPPAKRLRIDADGFAVPEIPMRSSVASQVSQGNIDPALQEEQSGTPEAQGPHRGRGRQKGSKNWVAPPPTPEEIALEEELTTSMQEALDQNQDLDTLQKLPTPEASQILDRSSQTSSSATQQQSQLQSHPEPQTQTPAPISTPTEQPTLPLRVDPSDVDTRKDPPGPAVNTNAGNTGTVSLNPIISETEFDSDPEVSTCLLTEAERILKEKIWVTENADWLRQDHAKRIRRELKDRHLREQGVDPDELRKGKLRKRKDGARRSGRIGDIGYLNDDFHKKSVAEDTAAGTENPDGAGEGGARRPSTASLNVKAMMKQRGTYSRRINYDNLIKAYEYPVGPSTSPSRSPSVDQDTREQSVVSVSSTGTPANERDRQPTRSIFSEHRPRRNRRSAVPAKRPQRGGSSRSPSATGSPAPQVEDVSRQRSGTAASPEPDPNRVTAERQDADNGCSGSTSPLSSTHTPAGVNTPGSATSITRIDRSMFKDLQKSAVSAKAAETVDDDGDEDEDEDDDDEEEEDDDDDDDDDDNEDNDLDNAFAGNYKENPVWEGEDEVVDD